MRYLNNVLQQDHRFVKKRIAASLLFRSVDGALRTIVGYEAMNMIRKGQIRWLEKGDVVGQIAFIEQIFGIAYCPLISICDTSLLSAPKGC